MEYILPTDSDQRKQIPIFSGVLNYFPLAIAAVARVSKRGNDKHNPGQPLHWARGKSMDHADCIARHLIDIETVNATSGEYEDAAALAWRALAVLQQLEERRLNKPASRGSSSPSAEVPDLDPPRCKAEQITYGNPMCNWSCCQKKQVQGKYCQAHARLVANTK